ncbi:hypothetical protein JOM56_015543 [Amanita muscaria]
MVMKSYKVAMKKPGYGFRTVDDIVNTFGAMDLIWHFENFLMTHSLPVPHSYNTTFPMFKKFSLYLPNIPHISNLSDLKDHVHIVHPQLATGWQQPVEAFFSTVLAMERPNFSAFEDSNHLLKDILVVQVHAIFQLPVSFQTYKGTLAYVEWFTPLHSHVPDAGMYQIWHSTHMWQPRASVIPIDSANHSDLSPHPKIQSVVVKP